jgi:enoyl-CoA hydratase/carnithine racemase
LKETNLGSKYLRCHTRDRVMTVRIDRAKKRNAMTQDMYRGVKRAAILADGDPELDILCLTGTDDVFAVGGDMSGEAEDPAGLATELDHTDHFPFRHLERCRKVVVSAINGLCHAGGLDMMLASDVAIASDRAVFRAPELLRGIPDPMLSSRLASHVGMGVAKYLVFTGATFDADEAKSLGLIGKVVPHEDFEEELLKVFEAIKATGPKARAIAKAEMNRTLPPVDHHMFKTMIMNPEMMEGLQAFLDKREPNWPRD